MTEMQYIAIILTFATVICTTNGLCNTCTTNGLACASGTSFRVCVNGEPQGQVIDCPANTVCTSGEEICAPAGSPSSCQKCGVCNSDSLFACYNYTSFMFCKDNIPDVNIYQCPTDLVCNVDTDVICSDPLVTGLGATCAYNEPTTETPATTKEPATTPNPETSPNAYCANKAFPGRYGFDLYCKKFISCILSGSANWIGNIYVCPNDTYFNTTSQTCGKLKPTNCS